jgi:predicted CoA-binding protein
MPLTTDEEIRELLSSTRTIAMIGASDRPDRHGRQQRKRNNHNATPCSPRRSPHRIARSARETKGILGS